MLGAVPMAALADRVRRVSLIPVMTVVWAGATALSGAVVSAFQLFWTNAIACLGHSYRISRELAADCTYPIQARSRVFAFEGLGRPLGQLLGPLLVGGIAAMVGGDDGWRWAFVIISIPPVVVAVIAMRMHEPPRGQFDQSAVLGDDEALEIDELEPSMSTALARLRKIRTFYYLATGVGVLGFALIAVPLQFNLLLEDRYALGAFDRGAVEALMWVGSLVAIPIAGRHFDGIFRQDPERLMRLQGRLVMLAGVLFAIALPIRAIGPLVIGMALAQSAISASFVAAPRSSPPSRPTASGPRPSPSSRSSCS